MGKLVVCGCGRHHIKVGHRHTVLWQDTLWDAKCAFEQAIIHLEKQIPPTKLLNIIEKTQCTLCSKPLGKAYKLLGDNLYHPNCLYDVGGEG